MVQNNWLWVELNFLVCGVNHDQTSRVYLLLARFFWRFRLKSQLMLIYRVVLMALPQSFIGLLFLPKQSFSLQLFFGIQFPCNTSVKHSLDSHLTLFRPTSGQYWTLASILVC